MTIGDAKSVARQWVFEHAAARPGFAGALLTGSTLWRDESAELPIGSDVDVLVILDVPALPPKLGKVQYSGALLDITFLPRSAVGDAETILRDYHLAGAFARRGVIADPSGRLAELEARANREFAAPRWVRARCDHAEQRVLANLDSISRHPSLEEKVMALWFAAGVAAHLPLVAALRNPTVRRRYIDARAVLSDAGRDDLYAELLALLGCSRMADERARHHLARLEHAFDAAAAVVAPPFAFAGDITPAARPIAIDGTRAMIEEGFAREAMFWLVASFARCQIILHADALGPARHRFNEAFWELLRDVGIDSDRHLQQRAGRIRQTLSAVRHFADAWIGETLEAGHPGD